MKKSMVTGILIIALVFLVGCLDYKAYDIPAEEVDASLDLVNEIAQIEKELGLTGDTVANNQVEEDIVLPDLSDEELLSEELQVVTVKENELVKLNVKVSDPDEDIVTHTFGKPLNQEGQWQTNYGDAGEYVITIKATDGLLTTEKDVKIIVERVNVPPQITALKDLTVNEGETVEYTPKVNDPNGDDITITVSTPLSEGLWKTDHTSSGEYQIRVLASDGELETEESFRLVVNDVNELPIITGVEDLTVKEGDLVQINPVVTDLDGDELTITISEPVGNEGIWQTDFTDHGEYFITVTADDSKDRVTKRIRLVVEDINKAPEILDVSLVVK